MVVIPGPISLDLFAPHFRGVHPEEEEILGSDLLADLHVGPIQGADGQRAIHRELHVAGAGCLLAGQGDLLGEIGGRVETLAVLDIEVGHEDHPDEPVDLGVVVDDLRRRS